MGQEKEYEGTAYIGVVGPEHDYGEAWRSIVGIQQRPGDSPPIFYEGTKGYELRQYHLNNFISNTEHDFALMLDHDMIFPADTLERLRSHKLPYVSGLYMRRQHAPIAPIWFENNDSGEWPQKPYVRDPERDKLHKIGGSGWGCVLIHREVILAVRAILRGEWEVIEDAMTLWPYDLPTVLDSLKYLKLLCDRPLSRAMEPYFKKYVRQLTEEIQPLRADKAPVGSDIRFPFFAKVAGYQMWGDPDVRPGHILNYPLTPDDFSGTDDEFKQNMIDENEKRVNKAREDWRKSLGVLGL